MEFAMRLAGTAVGTAMDVAPILFVFVVFQVLVLRRKLPNLRRIAVGFVCVLAGLTLFLVGLEEALFPIGETMAHQLTAPAASTEAGVRWDDYLLVYAFAAAIGFAATVAEPSLIAIALKAEEVSGGALDAQGLRIAVAVGVAIGVSLGCFSNRYGYTAALVHHGGIRRGHRSNLSVEPYDRTLGLRQRRCHDVHGDGAGCGRARARRGRLGARSQPADRRIRTHCVRQRVSDHVGIGLFDAGLIAPTQGRCNGTFGGQAVNVTRGVKSSVCARRWQGGPVEKGGFE